MGFTCGFYRANKNGYNLSAEQYDIINTMLEYFDNDWAKEHYATAVEYVKAQKSDGYQNIEFPSEAQLNAFRNDYIDREYHKSIFEDIEDWCSSGSFFHKSVLEKLKDRTSYGGEVTQEMALEMLADAFHELQQMKFKRVRATHAYTRTDISEGGAMFRYEYHSIPCDGVEVEDGSENFQRIDTDDWEYTNLFVPEHLFDEDEYYAYTSLIDCLLNILTKTDWNKQKVFYSGGY